MDKKPFSISCGSAHTVLCTGKIFCYCYYYFLEDGEAYSWGEGLNGALGVVSIID